MTIKWIFFAILSLSTSMAFAGDPVIEEKIEALNNSSISSLGISLKALTYLVSASGYSYIPLWHLEETGDINFVRELESAGYVQIIERQGLPDGTSSDEIFVNINPLKTGNEIKQCIQALKHNNTSSATL